MQDMLVYGITHLFKLSSYFQLIKLEMASSFSISALVNVRARCSFLGENASTSTIYVAVTGL